MHEIDSGDAPSIKEKIQRTPANFGKEEETHLKKMLDAGIIQPSVPSLCRLRRKTVKSDGAWITVAGTTWLGRIYPFLECVVFKAGRQLYFPSFAFVTRYRSFEFLSGL